MRASTHLKCGLLQLPDELLSMIVMEIMWKCTLLDKSPDLVSYQRRMTNHPAVQLEKIAFLGRICGRLRGIYKELINVPTLWTSPEWRRRQKHSHQTDVRMPRALPSSLRADKIEFATLVKREIGCLPIMPASTLGRLVELELYGRGFQVKDKFISRTLVKCLALETIKIHSLFVHEEGEMMHILEAMASFPRLQHFAVHACFDDRLEPIRFGTLFDSRWAGQITRLEISHALGATWSHFVKMMECFRGTLAVAVFKTYEAPDGVFHNFPVAESIDFPVLWRLTISYNNLGPPGEVRMNDSSPQARHELAAIAPLQIVKHAPSLAYFDCSQRLDIKTPAELDEVAKLVDREGWKRLRLRLRTWKGTKGERWTRAEKQNVFLGR